MAPDSNSGEPTKTIIVVTDNPEDLDVVREQIGDPQTEFVLSADTQEAMKKIQANSADLVLLDMGITGTDSVQFCRDLRADPETEAIPVIVLAGEGEVDAELVLSMGADGYVRRPFRRAELLSRTRTLLRLKELHGRVAVQNKELLEVNARLDRLNQELTVRNRELEQGMQMARRLQDALLPQQYPRVKNISFSHKYAPAEAVGGDVFQITGMADGRGAIFITDVSGHGVRAALVTSIVKTVMDYIDLTDKTPSDALHDFNARFRSVLGPMTPQIYATGVLMIVDGERRTVAVGSAGHPCPLVVSKEKMTAEPIITLAETGPALGFISDPEYPTVERELSVGDIVLAFTDGAYEVISEDGEMFGMDRMQELVAQNAHLIPRDLIQRIITETDEFMGASRRPDDVCLIALEVH